MAEDLKTFFHIEFIDWSDTPLTDYNWLIDSVVHEITLQISNLFIMQSMLEMAKVKSVLFI